jgi:hypothetical protein
MKIFFEHLEIPTQHKEADEELEERTIWKLFDENHHDDSVFLCDIDRSFSH